jgi:hypothetical protein
LKIIDNVNFLLGDALKDDLKMGDRLHIAASSFSIFAFEALRRELGSLNGFRFIFTDPAFTAAKATDSGVKQRREFFIPQARSEAGLTGTEFEIQLRNRLTQRAIARECAAWIPHSLLA